MALVSFEDFSSRFASHMFSSMLYASVWERSIGGDDEQNVKQLSLTEYIMWIQHYYGSDPSLFSSIRCHTNSQALLVELLSCYKTSIGANSTTLVLLWVQS